MTVKQLKARLEQLDDSCEVHVIHGGLHVPIAAVIGSINSRENQIHGFGILTGNREVLLAYVDRIEAQIRQASGPEEASEWQARLDFWTDSIDGAVVKRKPVPRATSHGPMPVLEAEIVEAPSAHTK